MTNKSRCFVCSTVFEREFVTTTTCPYCESINRENIMSRFEQERREAMLFRNGRNDVIASMCQENETNRLFNIYW